jgi:hypothetical protein
MTTDFKCEHGELLITNCKKCIEIKILNEIIDFIKIKAYEVGSKDYNDGWDTSEKYYLKYLKERLSKLK